MEIGYFWLLNQTPKKYFKLYYHPGAELFDDYPTTAHIGSIHAHINPTTYTRKTAPLVQHTHQSLAYNEGVLKY